jgi:hypothetical protein
MICGTASEAGPAARISSRRARSPGTKRSWERRSSGPLATSRMPVASSTIMPAPPWA